MASGRVKKCSTYHRRKRTRVRSWLDDQASNKEASARNQAQRPNTGYSLLDWMIEHHIPLTRENYMELDYWGNLPNECGRAGIRKSSGPRRYAPFKKADVGEK